MEIQFPPFCRSGFVTNPSSGGLTIPDPALRNPFRQDTWVDEIRFFFSGLTSAGAPQATLGPGSFLVKASLGRMPLTGGAFVPIWLLGRTLVNSQESLTALATAGTADPTFVWRFTKPLFLPAGEQPTLTILSLPNTPNGVTVYANMFGRSIPDKEKRPAYVDAPFACAFFGAQNLGGANYTDQSYERDLMNPFDDDLFVERFVGRVAVNVNASADPGGNFDSECGSGQGDQAGATNTFVRAVSSFGAVAVRDETPFDLLFHAPTHSWHVNTWLPPKGFFKFNLRESYAALTATTGYRPQISMIGYRKVKLNDVFS